MTSNYALYELLEQPISPGAKTYDNEIFDPTKIQDKELRQKLIILQSELKNPYNSTFALQKMRSELIGLKQQARQEYEEDKPRKKRLMSEKKYNRKLDKHHLGTNAAVEEINKLENKVSDMLFAAQANAIANSGAIIVNQDGSYTIDQSKISTISPDTMNHMCDPLATNIAAGKQVWSGDVSGKTVVGAGMSGLIGGGMSNLGYKESNVKNVIMIAKIITAALAFKYYRDHTSGFGEKAIWGLALYGLLSNNGLGGRDMLWHGSQNGTLDISKFLPNGQKQQRGRSPELAQQYNAASIGKEKVEGLKNLFVPNKQDLLKEYLKYDGQNRSFNNQSFLSDYGLSDPKGLNNPTNAINTGTPLVSGKSINDLNKNAAMGVIASLINANKTGNNIDLNKQINDYLKTIGVTDPNEIINLSSAQMNSKLQDIQDKFDTQSKAEQLKKQKDDIKQRSALNKWVVSLGLGGMIIIEGKEEEVKSIQDDTDLNDLEKIQLLQSNNLLRKISSSDIPEITNEDNQTLTNLKNIGYSEQNALSMVSALKGVEQTLGVFNTHPKLIFTGTSLYYQNHGKKIEIKSKSQDETMKYNLKSLGLPSNIAQGITNFKQGLLLADVLCNMMNYIGKFYYTKYQKALDEKKITANEFPFGRSETFKKVTMDSQASLFSLNNNNGQIDKAIKSAFEIGTGGILGSSINHSQIQSLLTTINGSKINGKSAWFEGQGISIPNELIASGGSNESTANQIIDYDGIQSIGDLASTVHTNISHGIEVLWSDIVGAANRIGGDLGDMLENIIPRASKILGMTYDELKKGITITYEDAVGGIKTVYADAVKGISAVYDHAKKAIEIIGPDIKTGMSWTINTISELTQKTIDELVKNVSNLFNPTNKELLMSAINSVGELTQGTVNAVGRVIRDSLDGTMQGTWDLIWNRDFAKLFGLWAGYQFVSG